MPPLPEGEGVNLGNPSGFIAYHVSIGSSGTQALAEWRELGGTSSDAQWFRLYGNVTDTLARTPDFLALDPNALPSPADLGTWAMGRGGQYATQVIVQQIDPDTGLISESHYTVVSDTLISKEEAEQQAQDDFGADENEAKYGLEVVGAYAIHGWQTEAWSR